MRTRTTKLGMIVLLTALCGGAIFFLYAQQGGKKDRQPIRIDLSKAGQSGQDVLFNPVYEAKSLPEAVRNELGDLAQDKEAFQSTDVTRGQHLPIRRLIFGGVSEKYSIVHYERGGIAHSFLVAIFEISDTKAKIIWVSNSGRLAHLRELKAMLEAGKLANELGRTGW